MTGTLTTRPPDGHPAAVRQVAFDWERTPLHWVPDDPFATHMINVLHLLLPAGERWFIDVVREAEAHITDDELLAAMKPFIGQEAWHARAHAIVLDHLAVNGVDTDGYTSALQKLFKTVLSAHDSWPAPLRGWWMRRRLAVVAALEHYTCVLGRWILESEGLDAAGADPTMLDLLRWHGSEEVEHRSLVFDVHEAVGGRYVQRCVTMMTTAPAFMLAWVLGVRYLMAHDPTIEDGPRWGDWLRAAAEDKVPSPQLLLRAIPRYLKPGHHPRSEAPTDLGMAYLSRSPAVRASS